jgi:plastocyanin
MKNVLAISGLLCAGLAVVTLSVRAGDKSTDQAGRVAGAVSYQGDVPLQTIPDNAGKQHPLLTVHRKSRGLQDAVVYLAGKFPPLPQEGETKPPEPVLIDQQDETFTPHVVALQDGQAIRFKNSDGGNHNVRSAALDPRNEFNVFTGAGTSYQHTLHADPKQRPIRIGCDLHRWMSAWIYVFDHPYFAVTDEQGKYEIQDVPPATYTLVVRQPDGGLSHEQEVTIGADGPVNITVRFDEEDLKLPQQAQK